MTSNDKPTHTLSKRVRLHFSGETYAGAAQPIEGFWLSLLDHVGGLALPLAGILFRFFIWISETVDCIEGIGQRKQDKEEEPEENSRD